jgi:hypothetical protein
MYLASEKNNMISPGSVTLFRAGFYSLAFLSPLPLLRLERKMGSIRKISSVF